MFNNNETAFKKSHFQIGEVVEVKNESEILKTLDDKYMLESLPFLPEMIKYCGKRYKVLKKVKKILVEGNGMRSFKNVVILEGVTCNGKFHDNCARTCLLFWKEKWLKKIKLE